jgi:glucuronoarabinoxylan endo-1,4-beta-xylanase
MSSNGFCKSLFLLLFLSLASAYGDTNIVVNPGFESGTDGWAGRSCQIEAVTTPVHSGSGGAKAYGRSDTWQGISQSILGKMVVGKTYRIQGWVRLENSPSDTVVVSIDLRDDSGNKYPNVARVTATDSNWTLVSGDFTLEDVNGTLTGLDVYFEGPAAGVNFYVDDANVYGSESGAAAPGPAAPGPATANPAEPNATGKIDVNKRYQKIEGFGASGAYFTMEFVNHKQKAALYNLLFKELGLDIFRISNTYDTNQAAFNEMVEIAKGGKAALGGNLKIMMSSWSPPASLKSDANLIGGTLAKKDGKYVYAEFGQWWSDGLTAYAKAGVKADYISIQNEPDFLAKWASCRLEPTETPEMAGYDAAFEAVWDKLNANADLEMPKMLAPEAYGIISARKYIDNLDDLSHVYGYAHHLYDCTGSTTGCGTEPDKYLADMNNFNSKYSGKPVFQTEYQHKEPNTWTQAMNTAILMHNSLTVEGAAGYLYWDLFWGPGTVSFVSLDSPDTYTINQVYYAFKQYSAFIDSGWQRVDASTDNSGLRISAYIGPDNKKLNAVIINTTAGTDISLDFSLKGFSISKGEFYRSSRTEKCLYVGSYKGSGPLKLPANSITTLALSAGDTELIKR